MALTDTIVLNSLSSVRRIEDTYINMLDSTMRKLERGLTQLLDQSRGVAAIDTALARQQIEQILLSSGYYQTTGALLNDGYQSAIDEAQKIYLNSVGETFQFAETSLERLNVIKDLDLGQFSTLGNDFSTTMTRTIADLNFGAVSFEQAVENLQASIDKIGNHAKTWVTTGLSGIYRESSMMLAKDNGITEFIYKGPLDGITRPFCREHVNRKYTADEIADLDNGQGLPVMQYGGGWNCRHFFAGVK